MGKNKQLSEYEKGQIDEMHRSKKSLREISKTIKRSRNCISNYLNDRENYGNRFKGGNNQKISDREKRLLFQTEDKTKHFAPQLRTELDLPVTTRRVQQILSSSEALEWKKMRLAPPLTLEHQESRLKWAQERHALSFDEWGRIIFSDEKKWNLDGPDGNRYYWHNVREEIVTLSRRQKGGGGVMVWGAFSERGTSELAFLTGNQTQDHYKETLTKYLLPFIEKHGGHRVVLQHDNAPIHKASSVTTWLKDNKITAIDWPARSPDLNPIENLWGDLSHRVYANGRQFETIAELKTVLQQEWDNISQERCYSLIRSMRNRCSQVLQRQGKKTDY